MLTVGNYDLVSLLCARKADVNVVFPVGFGKLGFGCPFAAAAAFGYRKIFRKLLAEAPTPQEDEMMSLAEILAEGNFCRKCDLPGGVILKPLKTS